LTRPGLEPTIYCAQDEQANHYATEVVVLAVIEERKNIAELALNNNHSLTLSSITDYTFTGL
jgi:hypothetical protein